MSVLFTLTRLTPYVKKTITHRRAISPMSMNCQIILYAFIIRIALVPCSVLLCGYFA